MSAHHLLVYLCAHGAKHAWYNPRWICDVAQIAERLSLTEIERAVSLAGRAHARRILLLGLVLASDLMNADISRFDLSELGTEASVRKLSARVIAALDDRNNGGAFTSIRDPRLKMLMFYTKSRERLIDRIAAFVTLAVVPSQRDTGSSAMRWITHPFRIVADGFRQFAA